MAGPIIFDPGPREAQMQAALLQGQAKGQMVGAVAGSIEQLLFDYQARKKAEVDRRVAASGALVSKYGFGALGPDFARQFETDTGVKFQRDAEGKPVVPQTFEEKVKESALPHLQEQFEKDPNAAAVHFGLMKPPPSPQEQAYRTRELDIKSRRNDVEERAAELRYKAALANVSKDTLPSGIKIDEKTGELKMAGPGEPQLNNLQFSRLDKFVKYNLSGLEGEKKQAEIDLLRHKLDDPSDSNSKDIRAVLTHYPKLTGGAKSVADALIQTWAEKNGYEWKEQRGWFGRNYHELVKPVGSPVSGAKQTKLQSGGGRGPAITSTTQPSAAPVDPKAAITKMSDPQLQDFVKGKIDEGMNPFDILQQSGYNDRVLATLGALGEQVPQTPPGK